MSRDQDPDFVPIDLAGRNKGPPVLLGTATGYAIRLRNRISGAVRDEDDEDKLEAVAALLGLDER